LLHTSFLDPNQIDVYANCCRDGGEGCASEEDYDCSKEKLFLEKDYAHCCEKEGEDCPEDIESSCEKVELLLQKVNTPLTGSNVPQ